MPEFIEAKQKETKNITNFIARWLSLTFVCPRKFTQHELVRMFLENSRHDLSKALMAQTFQGFNDVCRKAHDMELHLNKRKKPTKEKVKVGNNVAASCILQAVPKRTRV